MNPAAPVTMLVVLECVLMGGLGKGCRFSVD
jgi:hypothetical protein